MQIALRIHTGVAETGTEALVSKFSFQYNLNNILKLELFQSLCEVVEII